jgi:hypothetical protein
MSHWCPTFGHFLILSNIFQSCSYHFISFIFQSFFLKIKPLFAYIKHLCKGEVTSLFKKDPLLLPGNCYKAIV